MSFYIIDATAEKSKIGRFESSDYFIVVNKQILGSVNGTS